MNYMYEPLKFKIKCPVIRYCKSSINHCNIKIQCDALTFDAEKLFKIFKLSMTMQI